MGIFTSGFNQAVRAGDGVLGILGKKFPSQLGHMARSTYAHSGGWRSLGRHAIGGGALGAVGGGIYGGLNGDGVMNGIKSGAMMGAAGGFGYRYARGARSAFRPGGYAHAIWNGSATHKMPGMYPEFKNRVGARIAEARAANAAAR